MKRELYIFLLPVFLFIACTGEKSEMENIVFDHFQRHKNMEIQDLYKLAYQASMGVTHYISSPESARKYLELEAKQLDTSENVQMVEPLSPDGKLVRVNLRAYIKGGGDVDELFIAMMKSSVHLRPSTDNLESYWQIIVSMAEKKLIPFDKIELIEFFKQMKEADYPAVHHSEGYNQANHPAYRVILREYLPRSGGNRE